MSDKHKPKAPCLCCDGERIVVVDIGGGYTEDWGCPPCKATGFGPSWFEDERDFYRWDNGVSYDWRTHQWVRNGEEVTPADCMQCGEPLVEQTGIPLCGTCEDTNRRGYERGAPTQRGGHG